MTQLTRALLFAAPIVVAIAGTATLIALQASGAPLQCKPAPTKPAVTVTVVLPRTARLPMRSPAISPIAPWPYAGVGIDANGLRLTDVKIKLGDALRGAQVIATFAAATSTQPGAELRTRVAHWVQQIIQYQRWRDSVKHDLLIEMWKGSVQALCAIAGSDRQPAAQAR